MFSSLEFGFKEERWANICMQSLMADKEVKGDVLSRTMRVEDGKLIVSFTSTSLKNLRVSVNSFLEYLQLSAETIEAFG